MPSGLGNEDEKAEASTPATAADGRSEWPGIPRGLGNEDESTDAPIQPATAEVARFSRPGMAPVAKNHRETAAGASGLRGQAPSGVENGSESQWVAGRFALCHGPPPSN